MLVKCIKTTAKAVPLVLPPDIQSPLGEANYCSSDEYFTIDSAVDGYSLSCGKVYRVYGLLTVNGELRYLIVDEDNIPGFFPECLFQVVSHDAPAEWISREYIGPDAAVFYTAYPELNTYQDIPGIMEHRPSSVKRFIELKEWLEKWELFERKS